MKRPVLSRMRRGARLADAGQSLLELALALPILLAIVVGIFEFGRAWNVRQVMTNSAREGARLAVIPGTPPDSVEQTIESRLRDAGLSDSLATITITGMAAGPGADVAVTVGYAFTFQFLGPVVSFIGGDAADYGTISMSTTSTMRHE